MKKIVSIAVIVSFCWGISYADDIDLPHITVFGTAITKVTPDVMYWSLSVRNKAGDLHDVAKQHTKIVSQVLRFLEENKLPGKDIQTTRMEFGVNWEDKDDSLVKEGYFGSTGIIFKVEDFRKYNVLWMGLSKIANVSVGGVYYNHSKRIAYQNETRKNALLAAKEKAAALAEALGSSIGEPLLIEEEDGDSSRLSAVNSFREIESGSEMPEGIAPGKIPIRVRVKVAFRLITLNQ